MVSMVVSKTIDLGSSPRIPVRTEKNCIWANSSEGEHMSCKHITRVRVPIGPFWGCSSVGRAPALQAGGSGFESHQLHSDLSEDKPTWRNWQALGT